MGDPQPLRAPPGDPGHGPVGSPSVIKLVFSLRRRPEMSREDFQAYWRDQHAPLVASHAKTLRIRRYVQTHARASDVAAAQSAARSSQPDFYDGQAELWWDSLEDVLAAASSEEGRQAALELPTSRTRPCGSARSSRWLDRPRQPRALWTWPARCRRGERARAAPPSRLHRPRLRIVSLSLIARRRPRRRRERSSRAGSRRWRLRR
jgi:uncharacterized protein (TIGR02118 family)